MNGTDGNKNSQTRSTPIADAAHAHVPSGREFISWLTIGALGALMLFLALTSGQLFNRGIKAGDIAERHIVAPQAAYVIDPVATKEVMENARQLVIPVFQVDRSRDQNTIFKVDESMGRIKVLQSRGIVPEMVPGIQLNLSADEDFYLLNCSRVAFDAIFDFGQTEGKSNLANLEQSIHGKVEAAARQKVYGPRGKRTKVRQIAFEKTIDSIKTIFLTGRKTLTDVVQVEDLVSRSEALIALSVRPDYMSDYSSTMLRTTRRICNRFERFPVSDKDVWADTVFEFLPDDWELTLRRSSAILVSNALEPNLVIDPVATKKKADQTLKEVNAVTKKYEEGEMIVPKGTIITQEIAQTLQALGISRISSVPFLMVLGFTVIAAVAFAAIFIYNFEPKHFFSGMSLGLIYTVVIVACASASLLGRTYPQFVPMAGAALCLTIFFGRRVAAAVIIPVLVLIAVNRLVEGTHLLAISIAALSAIFGYSRDRKSLMFTGLVIGVAQALGFLVGYGIVKALPFLSLASTPWMVLAPHMALPSFSNLGQVLAMEFAGGLASAIIAIGCLPFLENIFGLVTPYRLAEMAEADQPLLQQLEEKAPGTYQHSLAVANLAEAAAKAIKVDVKLVRAGALYHDVGKMVRPKFFIENQLGAKNPHDMMSPEDSRNRVLAHVTDGLELARKYSLPKAIADFIPMHQGTTLMAYFYHKACERDGKDNVDPGFYRYPGPKPNSKETAIVMLADAAEAVTHSMRDPTEEEVEQAIDKIFQLRWADEQFSDANLSYDELQRVKLAFVRVWRTLHHERLKYPSTDTGKMDVDDDSENDGDGDNKNKEAKVDATVTGDEPCCVPIVLEEEKVEENVGSDSESESESHSESESDTAWSARGESCS